MDEMPLQDNNLNEFSHLFKGLEEIPQPFACCISQDWMITPLVSIKSGNSADKEHIEIWLNKNPSDPITRVPTTMEDWIPNPAITALKDNYGALSDQIGTHKKTLEDLKQKLEEIKRPHKKNFSPPLQEPTNFPIIPNPFFSPNTGETITDPVLYQIDGKWVTCQRKSNDANAVPNRNVKDAIPICKDLYDKNEKIKEEIRVPEKVLKELTEKILREKLIAAIRAKDVKTVAKCLESMPDLIKIIVDVRGNTLLHLAAMQNDREIYSLLLRYGHEKNPVNSDKDSLLHTAAKNNNVDLCMFLLENGHPTNVKNKLGKMPFQLFHNKHIPALNQKIFDLACNYHMGKGVIKDENKAFEYFQIAANQGFANAQFNLGHLFESGIVVAKNEGLAFKYYKSAADQGHPEAQCNIGFCYENSIGVDKDQKLAVKYYISAAKNEIASAQNRLGNLYEEGNGVNKDLELAFKNYVLASKNGNINAQFNLGRCLHFGIGIAKNEKLAFKHYKLAADQGSSEAQINLSACYRTGIGVDKDEELSLKYCKLAADQGDAQAILQLSGLTTPQQQVSSSENLTKQCHSSNPNLLFTPQKNIATENTLTRDVEKNCKLADGYFRFNQRIFELAVRYHNNKDINNAVKYYRLAAELGNAQAHCSLGAFYISGSHGFSQNYKMAVEHFQESANMGFGTAYYNLGICYLNGTGVPQDHAMKVKCFQLAANHGNDVAHCDLGTYYMNGSNGLPQDYNKAVEHFQESANMGFGAAYYNLGVCYLNGTGVPENSEMGVKCLQAAVELNCEKACCDLGQCYMDGHGIPKDYEKAKENFQLALNSGHPDAQQCLDYLADLVKQSHSQNPNSFFQPSTQKDVDVKTPLVEIEDISGKTPEDHLRENADKKNGVSPSKKL